jgi:hypothetical protein
MIDFNYDRVESMISLKMWAKWRGTGISNHRLCALNTGIIVEYSIYCIHLSSEDVPQNNTVNHYEPPFKTIGFYSFPFSSLQFVH